MSLRFSVLASGSTGNAFYIENGETRILVDAGLSGKKMDSLFEQIDVCPSKLSAILVTHEHSDHIKGLGIIARKYNLPIYANEKTWQAMEGVIGEIDNEQKFHFEANSVKTIESFDIESFSVSHDAADPMFFNFYGENNKKVTLITDLGYVSDRIKGKIKGASAYIFEANHDVSMLQMSKYPWSVKRRILGDYGHVSNEDCGIALSEVITDETKRVYLAHLSRENNLKELARMSVDQVLRERDIVIDLYDTDPEAPTLLYEVV